MANPQAENGHLRLANDLVDALMRQNLSPQESRILWAILRRTYGFNKKMAPISLSEFSKMTGMDRRNAHRALTKLSSKQMTVIQTDDSGRLSYGLEKDYEKWQRVSSKQMTVIQTDDKTVIQTDDKKGIAPFKCKDNKDSVVHTPLSTSKNGIPYQEIISKLNQLTGKNFKPETAKTKSLIKARWNEGWRLKDFTKVIETKTEAWMNDPKMMSFLRPETLFGTKFESYLNEKATAAPQGWSFD